MKLGLVDALAREVAGAGASSTCDALADAPQDVYQAIVLDPEVAERVRILVRAAESERSRREREGGRGHWRPEARR